MDGAVRDGHGLPSGLYFLGSPSSDLGSDPATGWVAVSRSGTAASQAITGLTNGTIYRVRVRWVNTNANPDEYGHYGFVAATPRAAGDPIWSATMTARDIALGYWGCESGDSSHPCPTANSFAVGGKRFSFTAVYLLQSGANQGLLLVFDRTVTDALKALTLRVDSREFALSGADVRSDSNSLLTDNQLWWPRDGLEWTENQQVALSLREPSANADLSGLTASSHTSATGTFNALALTPDFDADTTSYTATVANSITHAKLTPTVAQSAATVTVGGTAVTSGSASGAIALSVGANAITVQVTAQDTTTTKDYTVTITRQAPPAAGPAPPTGLSLTPGDGQLAAAWTAPTGVTVARYETQIKLKSAASWPTTDTDVTGTSHTFTGLTNGSPYLVRVRTVSSGEAGRAGGWSTPVEGTPQAAQSSNADLSGLTASSAASAGGQYAALTLAPAFAASITAYTATVANDRTHAKLTPTVASRQRPSPWGARP